MSEQERLKTWMEKNHYSEGALAAEVGMHYVSIFRMLRERRISDGFKLRFIARYGMDVAVSIFDMPEAPETIAQ